MKRRAVEIEHDHVVLSIHDNLSFQKLLEGTCRNASLQSRWLIVMANLRTSIYTVSISYKAHRSFNQLARKGKFYTRITDGFDDVVISTFIDSRDIKWRAVLTKKPTMDTRWYDLLSRGRSIDSEIYFFYIAVCIHPPGFILCAVSVTFTLQI